MEEQRGLDPPQVTRGEGTILQSGSLSCSYIHTICTYVQAVQTPVP